ncbi:MAG: hypothetical protein NTX24_01855 [Candidatus Pacearchaeota archaeon]|nr:hypothetical protein [Candidatus Pacearchaeota archaeon]
MEKVKSKKNKQESKIEIKKISEKILEKKSHVKKSKLDLENEVLVEKLGWLYQKKKEPEKENKDKKEEEKKEKTDKTEKTEKAEKREDKKEAVPEKKEDKKRSNKFLDESSEFHPLIEPETTKAVAPVLKSPEPSRDGKQVRDMEQIVSTAPSNPSGREENRDSAKFYDTLSDPKYYTEAYSNPSDLYEEKKSVRWSEEHVMEETRANMRPTRVRMVEEHMSQTQGSGMREGIKYELTRQEEKHSPGFVPEFTKYNKEKRKKT